MTFYTNKVFTLLLMTPFWKIEKRVLKDLSCFTKAIMDQIIREASYFKCQKIAAPCIFFCVFGNTFQSKNKKVHETRLVSYKVSIVLCLNDADYPIQRYQYLRNILYNLSNIIIQYQILRLIFHEIFVFLAFLLILVYNFFCYFLPFEEFRLDNVFVVF